MVHIKQILKERNRGGKGIKSWAKEKRRGDRCEEEVGRSQAQEAVSCTQHFLLEANFPSHGGFTHSSVLSSVCLGSVIVISAVQHSTSPSIFPPLLFSDSTKHYIVLPPSLDWPCDFLWLVKSEEKLTSGQKNIASGTIFIFYVIFPLL